MIAAPMSLAHCYRVEVAWTEADGKTAVYDVHRREIIGWDISGEALTIGEYGRRETVRSWLSGIEGVIEHAAVPSRSEPSDRLTRDVIPLPVIPDFWDL